MKKIICKIFGHDWKVMAYHEDGVTVLCFKCTTVKEIKNYL